MQYIFVVSLCFGVQEPVVDICKVGSSSDSPLTAVEYNQRGKLVITPPSLSDKRDEMETRQSVLNTRTKVSNGQNSKTSVMRPNITVPESLPFYCGADESDSFNGNLSVVDSDVICGDGMQNNIDIKHKDHPSVSSKPLSELYAPDSPVFNRGQQMIITPVYSSPSLFDEEDERSSAKKQKLAEWSPVSKPIANGSLSSRVTMVIESPSILRHDVVRSIATVGPEGRVVRSRCSDMEVKLLDQTAMSPPSPSVLSQKLSYYNDFELPAVPVNQTTVQAQIDSAVERGLSEIELVRGYELIHINTTSNLSTGYESEIECAKTPSEAVDKVHSYEKCERDPDETVCPFQTSYVSCDESLSVLPNMNIPVGDSPLKFCELPYSENVQTSLASLQTVTACEPNGSLAVGVELSEYMNVTGNTQNLLADNIVTGHTSRSVIMNKRMTRSQSQQSSNIVLSFHGTLKRRRLDDKLNSDLSSDEPVFDSCDVSKPVLTHLLQGVLNIYTML